MNLPSTFWDYMIRKWLTDAPVFPISQVFGFTQFTAQSAAVGTGESTASTTYVNLATNGPELDGLADGHYLIFLSAQMTPAAGGLTAVTVVINGSSSGDQLTNTGSNDTGTAILPFTLNNNGSNILKLQYRALGGSGSFGNRNLVALKFGNL